MKSKENYHKCLSIIKEVVNEWDPEWLLSHAPDDEYDYEIKKIAAKITQPSGRQKLAEDKTDKFIVSGD